LKFSPIPAADERPHFSMLIEGYRLQADRAIHWTPYGARMLLILQLGPRQESTREKWVNSKAG